MIYIAYKTKGCWNIQAEQFTLLTKQKGHWNIHINQHYCSMDLEGICYQYTTTVLLLGVRDIATSSF